MSEKSAGSVIFRIEEKKPIFLLLSENRHWGFPKGNIEEGESERETAIRETIEETGISNLRFVNNFFEKIEYFYRRGGVTIHKEVVYFLSETEQREVKLSFEHQRYIWLDFEESMKKLSFENEKKVLEKANDVIVKEFIKKISFV